MSEIKNIVFDIGYVLFLYRWKALLMDYGLNEEEASAVEEIIRDDPEKVWSRFDCGDADLEEVVQTFGRFYPEHLDVLAWTFRHPEYMHVPRPAIWSMVHRLKEKGYRLFLLSNYPEELFRVHTEYADFMKDVDGYMVSYMVHVGKPDRRIYEALCETYQIKPEECVFFDDRKENIDAAIAYGMSGIQVTTEEKFLADMQSFL